MATYISGSVEEEKFIKQSLEAYIYLVYSSEGEKFVTFEEYLTTILKLGLEIGVLEEENICNVIARYEHLILIPKLLGNMGENPFPTYKSTKMKIYNYLSNIRIEYGWFKELYKNLQDAKSIEKSNEDVANYQELLDFMALFYKKNNIHNTIDQKYIDLYVNYLEIIRKIRYEKNIHPYKIYLKNDVKDNLENIENDSDWDKLERFLNELSGNENKSTEEEFDYNQKNYNFIKWLFNTYEDDSVSYLNLGLDNAKIPETNMSLLFGANIELLKGKAYADQQLKSIEVSNVEEGTEQGKSKSIARKRYKIKGRKIGKE